MSRIGKKPIVIPTGTEVKLVKDELVVRGPKGELREKLNSLIIVTIAENEVNISVKNED